MCNLAKRDCMEARLFSAFSLLLPMPPKRHNNFDVFVVKIGLGGIGRIVDAYWTHGGHMVYSGRIMYAWLYTLLLGIGSRGWFRIFDGYRLVRTHQPRYLVLSLAQEQ